MRNLQTILLGLLLPLIFAACDRPRQTVVERANSEGVLILGNGAEPSDLDPQVTTGVTESKIHQALFEGLITLDGNTLEPRAGAAARWDISKDGRTYTFHLQPNAHWSNGDPVTAEDFVFSYKRMLTGALGAEYATNLFLLKNGKDYYEGRLTDFAQVGVQALDPHTLKIELENPTPYFLPMLNHSSWYPVHPPTIRAFNAESTRSTRWTRPGNHVGNGPYRLKHWRPGNRIVVEKNPHYWDADTVSIHTIRFEAIDNGYTEERAFIGGQLHTTASIPLNRVKSYIDRDAPELALEPELGIYYYVFNVTHPPFDDKRVRLALSYAIERELITKHIRQRGESIALCFTPKGINGYEPPEVHQENIDQARRLLAEAGYPEGEGFPQVTLLYNTSDGHRQIAEAIQQMWKKNLNIEIQLHNEEWKTYLQTRRNANFAISRAGWLGDYYDPNTFLDLWLSDNGNNHSKWKHETFDKLIHEAARTQNNAERNRIFQKAETILLEEAPVIPVFFYNRAYLKHPSLKNWPSNIMNQHPYKDLRLEVQP